MSLADDPEVLIVAYHRLSSFGISDACTTKEIVLRVVHTAHIKAAPVNIVILD